MSLNFADVESHVGSGFTSHPKEGVLRAFIAIKNPSPRPGLNPRPYSGKHTNHYTTEATAHIVSQYIRSSVSHLLADILFTAV
jgi:hypothetical protein